MYNLLFDTYRGDFVGKVVRISDVSLSMIDSFREQYFSVNNIPYDLKIKMLNWSDALWIEFIIDFALNRVEVIKD